MFLILIAFNFVNVYYAIYNLLQLPFLHLLRFIHNVICRYSLSWLPFIDFNLF